MDRLFEHDPRRLGRLDVAAVLLPPRAAPDVVDVERSDRASDFVGDSLHTHRTQIGTRECGRFLHQIGPRIEQAPEQLLRRARSERIDEAARVAPSLRAAARRHDSLSCATAG